MQLHQAFFSHKVGNLSVGSHPPLLLPWLGITSPPAWVVVRGFNNPPVVASVWVKQECSHQHSNFPSPDLYHCIALRVLFHFALAALELASLFSRAVPSSLAPFSVFPSVSCLCCCHRALPLHPSLRLRHHCSTRYGIASPPPPHRPHLRPLLSSSSPLPVSSALCPSSLPPPAAALAPLAVASSSAVLLSLCIPPTPVSAAAPSLLNSQWHRFSLPAAPAALRPLSPRPHHHCLCRRLSVHRRCRLRLPPLAVAPSSAVLLSLCTPPAAVIRGRFLSCGASVRRKQLTCRIASFFS